MSSLRLLAKSKVDQWPYAPAYYKEILHLQSLFILAFLHWTYLFERHEFIQHLQGFPPELIQIMMRVADRNARQERIRQARELFSSIKRIPPMDRKKWLIKATYFASLPRLHISLSQLMSEYLVFVHPLRKCPTWIAVFSRDAAIVSSFCLFNLTLLYAKWVA